MLVGAPAVNLRVCARAVGERLSGLVGRFSNYTSRLLRLSSVLLHVDLRRSVLCLEYDRVGARVGSGSSGRL